MTMTARNTPADCPPFRCPGGHYHDNSYMSVLNPCGCVVCQGCIDEMIQEANVAGVLVDSGVLLMCPFECPEPIIGYSRFELVPAETVYHPHSGSSGSNDDLPNPSAE